MDEVLRRWKRELRALGAHPREGALEELLAAPSLPEQAVSYARERREEGVRTADVVRELGALALIIGPDPDLLEALARVAADHPPPPSPEEWLALFEEGLVVLDADGAIILRSGPQPAPPDLARRALSTGKPQRLSISYDERVFDSEARPFDRLRGAAQVFRDRSERLRLQKELQRADRETTALQSRLARSGHLQALAEVSAGAALALNNELNAIALGLPLLRAARDEAERERRLASVEGALRRAAAVVDRVHQLTAPPTAAAPRAVDLNQILLEALDLVRPELTAAADERRVRVDARLGQVPPVLAQPSSLRELLSSLLVQARDALDEGGLLVIRTHAAGKRGEVEVRHRAAADAQAILGELALEGAQQLASATGAEVATERQGDERVLRVTLPLFASAPHFERTRRVLVVDDDADNREALAELLLLLGHEVEAVGTANAALKRVSECSFEAALLDFAMPEMNGLELARRLRHACPSLRLALVTGWEQTPAAPGDVDSVFHKPIDLPALQAFLGDTQPTP